MKKMMSINSLTWLTKQTYMKMRIIVRNPTKTAGVIPYVRSKTTYENPGSNLWKKATVMSRVGKASGKNKYWFNVKDLDDFSIKNVYFENVNGWKNINEEVLLSKVERFEITEAKLKELENWKNKNVYQELHDKNQNKISVRLVIRKKIIDGISKPKASLEARGFEDSDINVVRKDFPTCA